MQICEHMPLMAKQMHHLAIVRSMSTREADHNRGRYYMHTGYVPNPNIEHPELRRGDRPRAGRSSAPDLEIPPFVSVGGGSVGPGFLGMTYAPFVVSTNGNVRNLKMGIDEERLDAADARCSTSIEKGFVSQNRGSSADDHAKILDKTLDLMTSKQMEAFKVDEGAARKCSDTYGNDGFGRGCLMARRLVEAACRSSKSTWAAGTTTPTSSHTLQDTEAARARQGDERPGRRPRRARHAARHRHHLDGRVQPHAADQRQRRPRPLGPLAGAWSSAAPA